MKYKVASGEEEKKFADPINVQYELIRNEIFGDCPHAGNIATPYTLCNEMLDQIPDMNNKDILVLFNPEFLMACLKRWPAAKITMITGSMEAFCIQNESGFCGVERMHLANPFNIDEFNRRVLNMKKFDVVIGNPPYQDPNNKRSPLWQKFVKKSFDLTKDSGHISLIHPSSWRKPEHELFEMFKDNNLKYLEIHDGADGQKTFGAGTRYDWYILEKKTYSGITTIVDESGCKVSKDITKIGCIPHKDIEWFSSLLATDSNYSCKILYSRSAYATDKKHIAARKDNTYNSPVVYTTRKNGARLVYSSLRANGHFGIKKVIMGIASPENGFYDKNGEFGVSQFAMAIEVDSDYEGRELEKILKTDKFKKLCSICKWAGAYTDWRIFKNFKKDFWKEFV